MSDLWCCLSVASGCGHGSSGATERVALYLRVSSEEQRDRETIEIQREFLEQYRNLYELEVADIYKDDGISGTIPLHERAEGRRLLDDAKAGKFDVVLVYKLDRLGRSLLVIVDAHDRLQTAGVSLRSATEPIDTSNPSGRLIFQMLASFAEYERETIGERTRAGLHRALRNGKYVGRIPYGYKLAQDGSSLEVVEDEAAIVREIIERIAQGSTLYSESKRLNDESIPSPGWRFKSANAGKRKYGTSWSPTTVAAIVHQSAYSGTHKVKINGGETLIERSVPAIVDTALQKRASSALAENKRYPNRRADRQYLLRGLVKCEACGLACSGRTSAIKGRKYSYYVCKANPREPGRGRRVQPHRAAHVSAPWLEELVWTDVKQFLENPGEALHRVHEQLEEKADESASLSVRHADLSRRLVAKQAEKDRYIRLYAQDHISEEELETYLLDLRNQISNLRLLIESVEADLSVSAENKLTAKNAEAWLLMLRERIAEVEEDTEEAFAKRRELIKLLVERIDSGRDENGRARVQITYRFGPPSEPEQEDRFVAGEQNSLVFIQGAKSRSTSSMASSTVKTTASSPGLRISLPVGITTSPSRSSAATMAPSGKPTSESGRPVTLLCGGTLSSIISAPLSRRATSTISPRRTNRRMASAASIRGEIVRSTPRASASGANSPLLTPAIVIRAPSWRAYIAARRFARSSPVTATKASERSTRSWRRKSREMPSS
jgi:site-specific DNA recombinase